MYSIRQYFYHSGDSAGGHLAVALALRWRRAVTEAQRAYNSSTGNCVAPNPPASAHLPEPSVCQIDSRLARGHRGPGCDERAPTLLPRVDVARVPRAHQRAITRSHALCGQPHYGHNPRETRTVLLLRTARWLRG